MISATGVGTYVWGQDKIPVVEPEEQSQVGRRGA